MIAVFVTKGADLFGSYLRTRILSRERMILCSDNNSTRLIENMVKSLERIPTRQIR